ncbi:hypothetical protein HPB48_012595 [Haemaphysalis longicornis]|uniref:C2H2-type domain-containing protein n=1 Tax=Haemaphysalis longicornis TaxID=44386 RepID=A0A9J6H5K7_HAELO|nr:hypothetical protein HPB48_012595 [Haemaphysalis longicornis]
MDAGGGPGTDLPRGLTGKRVVHCKVCNVFTNSAKQLAEHLGGGRHKLLCFKLNVPITTLEPSPEDVHTLECTRLEGSKLVCKHCSVELNSKQQYDEVISHEEQEPPASPDQHAPPPMRKIKKELRPFFKNKRKEEKREQEEGEPAEKTQKREYWENRKKRSREGEKGSGDDEKEEAGKEDASKEKVKKTLCTHTKEVLGVSVGADLVQARDKYKFNLLDDLSEMPSLRNEITFANCERKKSELLLSLSLSLSR